MPTRLASAALLALFVAACQPYVYELNEFNRERPDFGRERTDRAAVDICYYTAKTTPQDLLAVAESECGKFGKTARYQYSDVLECPMVTPLRARFTCEAR